MAAAELERRLSVLGALGVSVAALSLGSMWESERSRNK